MNRFFFVSLLTFALLATACSSAPAEQDGAASETTSSLAPDAPDVPGDSAPDGLAFTSTEPYTLRISVPSMDFVAPHEVDETNSVEVLLTDLLTDGLTVRDSVSGIAAPGVASSWSSDEDGLVWTFTLGDSTFGDGSPILAADVVASLNRVADRGVASISGTNLWPIVGWEALDDAPVEGVVAVDETTVQIVLSERFEPLPQVLAGVAFGIWPADPTVGATLPISSAIDFTPTALWDDGIRFAGEERAGEVSTIEVFVDPGNTMLEAGETDLAVSVDPEAPLGDLRGATVERSADAFFAMNSSIAPFDDVMIRQAIIHAIDRAALRDQYFPNAGLMQGFVPQHVLGGVPDACGAACEFDVAQAQLLVDASPSRGVEFTVDYYVDESGDDFEQRLAESLVSSLRAIGLLATARSHSVDDYGARAASGVLGLFRFGSVSTTLTAEADLGAMFHTSGRDNLTGTSNARFDELIAAARNEANPVVRASIYESAETLLFGEAVVLPLVEFRHSMAFGPALLGAGLEPDGSLDLSAMEFAPSS